MRTFIALAAAALCVGAAAGCVGLRVGDGYLGVDGYVYEWINPPLGAQSVALIDPSALPSPGEEHSPIQGCFVTLEPWAPGKGPKPDTAQLLTRRGTTDESGHFVVGGTASPGHYEATLAISCSGYHTNVKVFRHDRLRHTALIVMARL